MAICWRLSESGRAEKRCRQRPSGGSYPGEVAVAKARPSFSLPATSRRDRSAHGPRIAHTTDHRALKLRERPHDLDKQFAHRHGGVALRVEVEGITRVNWIKSIRPKIRGLLTSKRDLPKLWVKCPESLSRKFLNRKNLL